MVLKPISCPTCDTEDVVKHGKPVSNGISVLTPDVVVKRLSPRMLTKDDCLKPKHSNFHVAQWKRHS